MSAPKGVKLHKQLSTSAKVALWAARIALLGVCIINVRCALQFVFFPEDFIAYYELSGVSGAVALQGLGVAFLMWNVTYPFAIANPLRFRLVYLIVLLQQLVGLVGELIIYSGIEQSHTVLLAGIERFIIFDAAGLVVMFAAFVWLWVASSRRP